MNTWKIKQAFNNALETFKKEVGDYPNRISKIITWEKFEAMCRPEILDHPEFLSQGERVCLKLLVMCEQSGNK